MTQSKLIPIILSGGSGTRLWPLSRTNYPKQFALKINDESLFMSTLKRASQLNHHKIMAVCNHSHRFFALETIHTSGLDCQLLLEPCARNTAPAFALAAQSCEDDEDSLLLLMPSDHLIADNKIFARQVEKAVEYANQGALVTFGVKPTHAETAYGYIITEQAVDGACRVTAFKEKPASEQAQKYLEQGNCYWNSGIFMCKKSVYENALQKHQPQIMQACSQAWRNKSIDHILGENIYTFSAEDFEKSPSISIDYAVAEHLDNIVTIPIETEWSDLGSWNAMRQVLNSDANGNDTCGNVVDINSQGNIVYSSSKLVALCGVNNQIVVETPDSILVADKSQDQSIKQLVEKLREEGHTESDWHRKVYRPWGSYEQIDTGDNFQVKRLIIEPGQKLSLQRHKHRSEHWVVVKGIAEVTINDQVSEVKVNQSVCIPVGAKHCLENKTSQPLWLIEVQCGDYLGEDDIERFDDIYGRTKE